MDGDRRPRLGRRPNAYLGDGHAGRWDVPGPLAMVIHEAGWLDDELRHLINPDFVREIAERTEAALRGADRVIAPSEASRRQVLEGYGLSPAKVVTVPYGVDVDRFRPNRTGGRALVQCCLGEDRPYVLFTSVVHPRKNLGALREAMSRLARAGYPHALALVASPALDRPDSDDLQREAVAHLPGAPNRIAVVSDPTDDDLAALMAEADVYCLPSLFEGFGLTALEAMACGTPVVVSDRGALPEVVGDAGLVVAPDADAVTNALERVLGDPSLRDELSRAGRARAETLTWEHTAAGWRDVLAGAADAQT